MSFFGLALHCANLVLAPGGLWTAAVLLPAISWIPVVAVSKGPCHLFVPLNGSVLQQQCSNWRELKESEIATNWRVRKIWLSLAWKISHNTQQTLLNEAYKYANASVAACLMELFCEHISPWQRHYKGHTQSVLGEWWQGTIIHMCPQLIPTPHWCGISVAQEQQTKFIFTVHSTLNNSQPKLSFLSTRKGGEQISRSIPYRKGSQMTGNFKDVWDIPGLSYMEKGN